MIGVWILLVRDLRVGIEIQGGPGWCAVRQVAVSPLFGLIVSGEWVTTNRVTP